MTTLLATIQKTKHETPPRILIHGAEKTGKALDTDTKIPTPSGFVRMGDLSVGDVVFDGDGNQCRIIAATDIMFGRPCYKVTFRNGFSLVADESHLWRTKLLNNTNSEPTIRTTLEILSSLKTTKSGSYTNNHFVPWHFGAKMQDRDFDLDPYVLGVWLGDGGSNGPILHIAERDSDIIQRIRDKGEQVNELQVKNSTIRCSLTINESKGRVLGVLREFNLLGNKHIPSEYLLGSYAQRLELLRGLMDTDGYVDKTGKARHEFSTCSKQLADGVGLLLASLGIIATTTEGRAMLNGNDCGPKWRIEFSPHDLVVTTKFKMLRATSRTARRKGHMLSISSIEPVDSVPVRCIHVSSKDGMFLAGEGFIPTHNSTLASGAPKPIFIRTEDGLNGIDTDAFPLALDAETVRQQLMTLVKEDHDFKTVVLDSADWLERLIHEAVCKKEGVDNIVRAGGGYGAGYTLAMNIWKAIFALLDKLNREKGMIVVVICHSRIITINDPLHEPYDVASLKLHTPKNGNGAADMLKEWADIIGYARIPLLVADGKPLSDASTGGNILILGNSPGCLAGNRYGLPHELPLSWRAFQAAFKKSTTNETTTGE